MTSCDSHSLSDLLRQEAAFIQSGLALIAGSRSVENRPSSALVLACRVSADGQQLSLVIRPSQCPQFLLDVRETGMVAFACTEVISHRSLQIKGSDAKVVPVSAGDFGEIVAQTSAFVETVVSAEHLSDPMMRAYVHFDLHDLAVVTFTPSEVFNQTPGPVAGVQIPCH